MTKKCVISDKPCVQETNIALIHQSNKIMKDDIKEIKSSLKEFIEKIEEHYATKSDCEKHTIRLRILEKIIYWWIWLVLMVVWGALLSKIII